MIKTSFLSRQNIFTPRTNMAKHFAVLVCLRASATVTTSLGDCARGLAPTTTAALRAFAGSGSIRRKRISCGIYSPDGGS